MPLPSTRTAGFTLVEALIVMAVAAIVLGLAVPAVGNATAAAHAGEAQADLVQTLTAGMAHSTVTLVEVVVCPSGDGTHCRGGSDWSAGWIAFADLDGDRERGATETLVRQHGALPDGTHLRTSTGRPRIVLQPTGGAASGSNATFTLCDGRGPAKATALVLASSGRLRQSTPTQAAALACLTGT
ncbi:MAG: GspH/FimT family pseudopilin [Lysobacteraceae bacterium]